MIDQFIRARARGVPLIGITTADQPGTTAQLGRGLKPAQALIRWSCATGLQGLNAPALQAGFAPPGAADLQTVNPAEALPVALEKAPAEACVVFCNADRFLDSLPSNAIAVCNAAELRDPFKATGRTLVCLAPQWQPPAELSSDILMLDEPLPAREALRAIVANEATNVEIALDEATLDRAADALAGLSAFAAEQATALGIVRTDEGVSLDVGALWTRKRRMISDTPGLQVYGGRERFSDIGGNANIKWFLAGILAGNRRPRAIVFVDEIEKALAGSAGDTSGVTQDQLGVILAYMQDTEATGILMLGPPGAGKSAIAKAAGNEAGIPTIQLDLGGVKGGLVGQSEQQLRSALKVVTAVSDGRPLFLATCNSVATLPPELRRRFSLGTFFFDLPDPDERAAIWKIYLRKFGMEPVLGATREIFGPVPPDKLWTGAEIRNCCDIADRRGISLAEAAAFVVPVAVANREAIEALRRQASDRYISASRPGLYRHDNPAATTGPRVYDLQSGIKEAN